MFSEKEIETIKKILKETKGCVKYCKDEIRKFDDMDWSKINIPYLLLESANDLEYLISCFEVEKEVKL